MASLPMVSSNCSQAPTLGGIPEDVLRAKAKRNFHKVILGELSKEYFQKLSVLVETHGNNSPEAQSYRALIGRLLPMPIGWIGNENKKNPLADSSLDAPWLQELQVRGYGHELLERLRCCLSRCNLVPAIDPVPNCVEEVSETLSIQFQLSSIQDIGDRSTMEDVYSMQVTPWGVLSIVADGHKDQGLIASYAMSSYLKHLGQLMEHAPTPTFDILQTAWSRALLETRQRQDQILKDSGHESFLSALSNNALEKGDAAMLAGGAVMASALVTLSGQLMTLSQGDCGVHIICKRADKWVCLPASRIKDFRCKQDHQHVGDWIAMQRERVKPRPQDCHSLQAGNTDEHDLAFLEMEQNWPYWPEYIKPPYFTFGRAYTNISRAITNRWLEEMTNGILPISKHQMTWIEKPLQPGDFVITHSDGFNLSCEEVERVVECLDRAGKLDSTQLIEELRREVFDSQLFVLPKEIAEILPKRSCYSTKKAWLEACDEQFSQFCKTAEISKLQSFIGALPLPGFYEDFDEWKNDCEQAILHCYNLCYNWQVDPTNSSAELLSQSVQESLSRRAAQAFLNFLRKQGSVFSFDLCEVADLQGYLEVWRKIEDFNDTGIESHMGLLPLGLECDLEQWISNSVARIAKWACQSCLDNFTVCAVRVTEL